MSHELKLESFQHFFQRKSIILDKSKEVGHFFITKRSVCLKMVKFKEKLIQN